VRCRPLLSSPVFSNNSPNSGTVSTSRGVVVNFDWGNGFRDLGPSNGGACAPAHDVAPSRTHSQHGYAPCAGAQAPPLLGPVSETVSPNKNLPLHPWFTDRLPEPSSEFELTGEALILNPRCARVSTSHTAAAQPKRCYQFSLILTELARQ